LNCKRKDKWCVYWLGEGCRFIAEDRDCLLPMYTPLFTDTDNVIKMMSKEERRLHVTVCEEIVKHAAIDDGLDNDERPLAKADLDNLKEACNYFIGRVNAYERRCLHDAQG